MKMVLLIASLAFIAWLVIWLRRRALASLARIESRIPRLEPGEEDVNFVFHTYHGHFLSFEQTEHCLSLPHWAARRVLRELHHFNLIYGWTAGQPPFPILLSFYNYWKQVKSINAQLKMVRRTVIARVQRESEK